ncbi:MAG: hypothetical protein RSE32_07785 [Comamonas sp.]|uniref:Nmad2 family putative nucleotide modification protein n=1 Tax=Comamonas sp. TaxID=34028 RepID=UPI002FC59559
MTSVFMYAVSYDLGFAPNPFGGMCSLACCKPRIREQARIGDWVVGMTGTKLKPAMRCIFAMEITSEATFDDYWSNPDYVSRRPVRNGTPMKQVGDNIYHRTSTDSPWQQEDSVHSLIDGSQSELNTKHDTRINRVLLSTKYVYLGSSAEPLTQQVINELEYKKNPRDYFRFKAEQVPNFIAWLKAKVAANSNRVIADPINFSLSGRRFDPERERMI